MSNLNQNTASLQTLLDTVNALPSKVDTTGTAVAADIYTGKTAVVNDVKLTGTNPYNAANVDPAVTQALAALVEKGVDTSGAGLADIAGLIAAIEVGGGSLKIVTGSFTPSSNLKRITVTHGLGSIPIGAICVATSYSSEQSIALWHVENGKASFHGRVWQNYNNAWTFEAMTGGYADITGPGQSNGVAPKQYAYAATDTSITFGHTNDYGDRMFVSGKSYTWCVFA